MVTMILWVIFALMTAAAILAVVRPLGRSRPASVGGSDLAVYKDQLKEIDSDRASGLISIPARLRNACSNAAATSPASRNVTPSPSDSA